MQRIPRFHRTTVEQKLSKKKYSMIWKPCRPSLAKAVCPSSENLANACWELAASATKGSPFDITIVSTLIFKQTCPDMIANCFNEVPAYSTLAD